MIYNVNFLAHDGFKVRSLASIFLLFILEIIFLLHQICEKLFYDITVLCNQN